MTDKVRRTERGWSAHFILSYRCVFHRNTLLELDDMSIVVSSVGWLLNSNHSGYEELGVDRYFETMAFHSYINPDCGCIEADVERQIYFESPWSIDSLDMPHNLPDDMHETVVAEISENMLNGDYCD